MTDVMAATIIASFYVANEVFFPSEKSRRF